MAKFKTMVLCVLIVLPLLVANLTAQEKRSDIQKGYKVDENGNLMKWMKWSGKPPKDPVVSKASPDEVYTGKGKGLVKLSNIPGYSWSYGCTATSTAMWIGYYDRFGADNMYTGPENGGVQPLTNTAWTSQSSQTGTDQCAVAASKTGVDGRTGRGHGDDYWTNYGDEATDPYYGSWAEHDMESGQPCTADFMGTNQWYKWSNSDGSTSIWNYSAPTGSRLYDKPDEVSPPGRDGCHGMRLFIESLGYTVVQNYNQLIDEYVDPDDPGAGPVEGGYTFADYKDAIDKGRPVLIHVVGHTMLGYGYDEAYTPPRVYCRNTWSTATTDAVYFSWGGIYSDMQHYAMTEIILGTECYYAAPYGVLALNNNRAVTVTWNDPSKGTKNLTYTVFRDGSSIQTGVTATSYVDNSASDGVHSYSVQAVYTDPTPDVTSFMSESSSVYVCASVTSFNDTFENTWAGQWLTPTNATYGQWGRDTQYKYAGTYSFGDSPATDYLTDNEEIGGIVAEVAPGLNFSTAADATCTFYLKHDYEDGYDFLYFEGTSDGTNWTQLKSWTGTAAFHLETISLGLYAGLSNARFRFRMQCDDLSVQTGCNVDNFSITPSTTDLAAPFVAYTKELDWYCGQADGLEISTTITDFSGIDYARILYKVNGGSELTLNPSSVVGSTYNYKFPEFTPNDLIEFRFDCKDTSPAQNQAYKGPFYYRAGLHQKYDNGDANRIIGVKAVTTVNKYTGIANKFNSFHDGIVGMVIRGYDDSNITNAKMLVTIWANNNGLPGAALMTPVAVTNPATDTSPYNFGYVDLEGLSGIGEMVGEYFGGITCDPTTSDSTFTWLTTCEGGVAYDYGMSYVQYNETTSSKVWVANTGYNFHCRIITTNNEYLPGTISPSPSTLVESVLAGGSSTRTLTVNNIGGYSLDYTGSIDYTGYAASSTINEQLFATTGTGPWGIWTRSGTRAWTGVSTYDSGSLNGSNFVYVTSPGSGTTTTTGYLTSSVVNLSTYGVATISFQQKKSMTQTTTSSTTLEASNDGTTWTPLYTNTAAIGAWNNPDVQNITIPETFLTSTARFRFGISTKKNQGYWAIDNVVIAGSVPYTWMTLDGSTTTSGTVASAGSDPVTVGFNTTGLAVGSYNAVIKLASLYSNENVFVQLNVTSATPPAAPTLNSPADASSLDDITPYFDWTDVSGATSYTIQVDNNSNFSSPEVNQSVTNSNYQQAANLATGTYYWKVLSTNLAGSSSYTSPWSVTLQAPVSTFTQSTLAGAAVQGATDSDTFDIGNTGNAALNYTITADYVTAKGAKADFALLSNDFNSTLGWTPTGYLVWAQSTDQAYDLDTTGYARLACDPDDDANGSASGVLTSAVFDGSASYAVYVDFDQYAELLTSSCMLDYTIDGTTWINAYTNTASIGSSGTPNHQRIKLPTKSATMQIRFNSTMKNQSGSHWNIDNVAIEGLNPANYGWLTVSPLSGSVAVSGSSQITATYNATGMDAGTYNANITIASNDPYTPSTVIPVTFVVSSAAVTPGTPANVTTSIVSGNVYINWDDAADATSYDVYSSATPYGTFALLTNVTTSEYTYTGVTANAKMFFYIVSKNTTKVSPKTIDVKKATR
ncbi:MAG TPA: hypothetical protein PLK90_05195 [Clostridiales bacterium]|nr:hypothetical protein [Clostridiales bacterium]HQP69779.1 hypothetical protein [Clostridiales bacterium]